MKSRIFNLYLLKTEMPTCSSVEFIEVKNKVAGKRRNQMTGRMWEKLKRCVNSPFLRFSVSPILFRFRRLENLFSFCIVAITILLLAVAAYSQDTSNVIKPEKPKKETKPVKNTFERDLLINNQTIETLRKKTLQFNIQHRFGRVNDNGIKDLYGIFGPANIRLGLNYGITDKISVGIGGTKNEHLYDIQWKYKILHQTKSGSIPLTITYYGNAEANTSTDDKYETFSNRLSYFHQLIIGRKFGRKLSLQLASSIAHYNLVDTVTYSDISHENIGLHIGGKYTFSPQSSIIFEYNHPLTISDAVGNKPDLGIGVEISTGSHQFQIFLSTAGGITDQTNMVFNSNDFTKGEMMLGFNISRRWRF